MTDLPPPQNSRAVRINGSALAAGELSAVARSDAPVDVLRAYLMLIRRVRGTWNRRTISLRHEDVDMLSEHLGWPPDQVLHHLEQLMGGPDEMTARLIRPFVETDRAALIDLWHQCDLVGPDEDPCADIARKLEHDPAGLLVDADASGRILASVMVGDDGHRGTLRRLAIDPDHHDASHEQPILVAARELLVERGCTKAEIRVAGRHEQLRRLYESAGFAVDDAIPMSLDLHAHPEPARPLVHAGNPLPPPPLP